MYKWQEASIDYIDANSDYNATIEYYRAMIGALVVKSAKECGLINRSCSFSKVLTNIHMPHNATSKIDVSVLLKDGRVLTTPIYIETNFAANTRRVRCNDEDIHITDQIGIRAAMAEAKATKAAAAMKYRATRI